MEKDRIEWLEKDLRRGDARLVGGALIVVLILISVAVYVVVKVW